MRELLPWRVRHELNKIRDRIRLTLNRPAPNLASVPILPSCDESRLQEALLEHFPGNAWCLDRIDRKDGEVEIFGWAIPPLGRYDDVTFTLNGRAFDEIHYPMARADIQQVFWYLPFAGRSAFQCRTALTKDEQSSTDPLTVAFADRKRLAPLRTEQRWTVGDPRVDRAPLPSESRRSRIQGTTSEDMFRSIGFDTAVQLDRALREIAGVELANASRILDWGCGSGRVARYIRHFTESDFVGIDIDEDNVRWCRQNLGFGRFEPCQLNPPTHHADESFDVVYGISVMTHLSAADRDLWLQELCRLLVPNGICLLTVQGIDTLSRSVISWPMYQQIQRDGFVDLGRALEAGSLTSEPHRYIDNFLMPEYIEETWSKEFEILKILPGCIGNMQDLVVMRRPGRD